MFAQYGIHGEKHQEQFPNEPEYVIIDKHWNIIFWSSKEQCEAVMDKIVQIKGVVDFYEVVKEITSG